MLLDKYKHKNILGKNMSLLSKQGIFLDTISAMSYKLIADIVSILNS